MQVALKPFLVACSTKSPKLANTSVASIQKLLTRHGLRSDGLTVAIRILEQVRRIFQVQLLKCVYHFQYIAICEHAHQIAIMQVERVNDEGVKLKILQTSLTLMQMSDLAQDEVDTMPFLITVLQVKHDNCDNMKDALHGHSWKARKETFLRLRHIKGAHAYPGTIVIPECYKDQLKTVRLRLL